MKLDLPDQVVDYIMSVLIKRPYRESVGVIQIIQQQANGPLNRPPAPDIAAPTPSPEVPLNPGS
jgi:hypothetical protein